MYAWILYFVLLITSIRWLLTPTQAFYCLEIGAHLLFVRKAGVYIIRASRKLIEAVKEYASNNKQF